MTQHQYTDTVLPQDKGGEAIITLGDESEISISMIYNIKRRLPTVSAILKPNY